MFALVYSVREVYWIRSRKIFEAASEFSNCSYAGGAVFFRLIVIVCGVGLRRRGIRMDVNLICRLLIVGKTGALHDR